VAQLKGKRLVAINEMQENAKLNEERVKYLTGNDTVDARALYKDPFSFAPSHKVIITTNHKPVIRGTDGGIWRRIHLVPFTVQIPEDKIIKDFRERHLIPELSGILNWALRGLADYHRLGGLKAPQAVAAATDQYRDDMDILAQWLDDRCEVDGRTLTPVSELYTSYKNWTENEALGWALSKNRFARMLAERGYPECKDAQDRRCRRGIKTVPLPYQPW
jgi:putative DNA primase/helicase